MQTLTTAMGPLMMKKKNPSCVKQRKSKKQWLRYVHGASALFADHVAKSRCRSPFETAFAKASSPRTFDIPSHREAVLKGIFGGALFPL
jgi:hypothetical protein